MLEALGTASGDGGQLEDVNSLEAVPGSLEKLMQRGFLHFLPARLSWLQFHPKVLHQVEVLVAFDEPLKPSLAGLEPHVIGKLESLILNILPSNFSITPHLFPDPIDQHLLHL